MNIINRVNCEFSPNKLKSGSGKIREILDKALNGEEIDVNEGVDLFGAIGDDRDRLFSVANELRKKANGDKVSFVVNRNINFTNICYMGCKFCGFAKRMEDKKAEWLDLDKIVLLAQEAWDRGATEVCIQGGLHPRLEGGHYKSIIESIKMQLPDIHIHAFSPFEIWYGASKRKISYEDFLLELKEAGLGSIPGTAAEILDVEVRQKLTKNKLSSEKWIEIVRTAHNLGIPSTSTIMYGHVDSPHHWSAHIDLLRQIQKETGGFTELVPLSFVHKESPLFIENPHIVRPGPTSDEVKKMHAVARIMLNGWIDNIQVSWTKLGAEVAQKMLNLGVNDLGGTLMNESISRAAGSSNGQEITSKEFVEIIRHAGKIPVRRNTIYQTLEEYTNHDPIKVKPLIPRRGKKPTFFLKNNYSHES